MKHTIIALVEDKPGVLNRVVSLFRRRNYNIESLAVGPCETPGVSRLTIVTDEIDSIRQNIICNNLLKLINVIEVEDVTNVPCVIRENVLIKVQINTQTVNEVKKTVKEYDARIVDEGNRYLIIEITDGSGKIDSVIKKMNEYGIIEMVRSGKIAITCENNYPNTEYDSTTQLDGSTWVTEQISNYLN